MAQLAFTALDAVTSTGPGAAHDTAVQAGRLTLAVSSSGDPDEAVVALEGSLDGETWFRLGTVDRRGLASDGRHVVQYVRANLISLAGGTSPAVTAVIG